MKHLFLLFICSILCSQELFASFEGRRQDAASLAMGGSCSTLHESPFTALCNPAAPAMLTNDAAGIAYGFPFGQSGLSTIQGALVLSSISFDEHASAAIAYERFGNGDYRESTALFSYARALSSWLYAGIGASYMQRNIPGYIRDSAAGVHAGIAVSAGKAAFDLAVANVNTPSIGEYGEIIAARTTAGASYRPVEHLLLSARIDHRQHQNIAWRCGGEAAILNSLLLRAGVTGNPSTVSAGAGVKFSKVSADIAVTRHPDFNDTATALSVKIEW